MEQFVKFKVEFKIQLIIVILRHIILIIRFQINFITINLREDTI